MEKYVFISYSTKNSDVTYTIKELLEKRGFDVWLAPNDIPIGQHYANVIEKAIQNCTALLLVMSRHICTSMWINKEIERAVNYGKPVLSVKLEEFELNDEFKFLLSSTQLSPLYDEKDFHGEPFERLVRDLTNIFNGEKPTGLPLKYPAYSKVNEEKDYDEPKLMSSAESIIEAFAAGSESCIKVLSELHYSEVNRFVKLLFKQLTPEQKDAAIANLNAAYEKTLADPSISGRKEYAIKGQIIFFLTRLRRENSKQIDRLKSYYYNEPNIWQRQSLAYGLATLGDIEVPFDFGKKIYEERDEAVINRSWTLVFFGDVQQREAFLYLDDGKADWTKCRTPRINRLKRTDPEAQAFRPLDLCLLHSFLYSRGWKISRYDYDVVKKASLDKKLFTGEQLRFLKKVKAAIIKNCKKYRY